MATNPPSLPPEDEGDVEYVDDPDLEASLDEPAPYDAEEVHAAMREMLPQRPITRP
ncbi:MAG TPA: hypothetical protein VFS43_32675 [Polyangiaceae bacterium]|nr:hypothetical protein [Polyangiaceae bacterium]